MRKTLAQSTVLALLAGALSLPAAAQAATPSSGRLAPDANGKGVRSYTGEVGPGTGAAGAGQDGGQLCFGADAQPADPAATGCDVFRLTVDVPTGFYKRFFGGASVKIDGSSGDIDLYIYKRNSDDTAGEFVTYSAHETADELATISRASGRFYVVVTSFDGLPHDFKGSARFATVKRVPPTVLNRRAPLGFPNYRASRDRYISHSETTIAMDPLNHRHLIAGSKMYENLPKYLFKVGSYESFDGGRTWKDHGHLPGYCEEAGQCDPSDQSLYRTTSDPVVDFDDEGNAYANVLDAPGGTFAFHGFNMTAHVRCSSRPNNPSAACRDPSLRTSDPWTLPITVHDNRNNPVTEEALLDDKNWLAVDNVRDVNGGPNAPRDGKIGTIYICWSFDQALESPVPGVVQQIVVMRSLDGGRTWGGMAPGDNTPMSVSQKGIVSGIGCHIAIGPDGTVFITWYDNQLGTLMQVTSVDRGHSFTPARPIAMIEGNDAPFFGQAFRNLSIPSSAVDRNGNVYVVVSARNNDEGNAPLPARVAHVAQELAQEGRLDREALKELAASADIGAEEEGEKGEGMREEAFHGRKHKCPDEQDQSASFETPPFACSDILLFKSEDGGATYLGPFRVNQDPKDSIADQFQPWLAVTPKGQVNVMYFDRRNDPNNFYIDTYLSRSNDGGESFRDTRVSRLMWDPSLNAPVSVSGEFIGDYQGLVADDRYAIPFWNDTQLAGLRRSDRRYSPWQEVFSARIPNTPASWIRAPRGGQRISARGARTIRFSGIATDPSGGRVTGVRLAVERRSGSRCVSYSSRRRRFVASPCGHPWSVAASGRSAWSVRLPRSAFKAGTYVGVTRAIGTRGRERGGEPGRNRISFVVG